MKKQIRRIKKEFIGRGWVEVYYRDRYNELRVDKNRLRKYAYDGEKIWQLMTFKGDTINFKQLDEKTQQWFDLGSYSVFNYNG